MPCDYSKYPSNWKSEIRPAILERANHKCENCKVDNYKAIFRGYLYYRTPRQIEVYQTFEGEIYCANTGEYLTMDCHPDIFPLSGKENQTAIKVVLTISHQDHNIDNNDYSNLKALCQRCHLKHDKRLHASNRIRNKAKKQNQLEMF